ncbi:Aminotransferase, class IV [Pseudocohnilembus persalinus]|uniref:Branched-chain-amino-acid aminotransferase n=1 Tax=Pseudocohnilembus persalinus TaxID=266149 RepID=A0A0V0QCW9_PSEPJ|nr:Aminotransferase, class IV [Pseudocohnilembus persalinus]|eukprot:KRW99959.1 Aminotransferase, class IV [Pseudocohnilembus persalinus]
MEIIFYYDQNKNPKFQSKFPLIIQSLNLQSKEWIISDQQQGKISNYLDNIAKQTAKKTHSNKSEVLEESNSSNTRKIQNNNQQIPHIEKILFNQQAFRFASYYENINLTSQSGQTFKASDIEIEINQNRATLPEWNANTLKFGANSTDHMLTIDWDQDKGWENPKIQPFQNFSIHPFNSTLHYGLECFEGLKAFRTPKGIRFFRADSNMYRLKNSMKSLSLPDFDGKEFQKCIEELVKVDQQWVPDTAQRGFSLYLRPTAISMEDSLGVKIPNKARLFCVVSPVGPYYPEGFKPIKLYCDPKRFRAAPFGTGNMKIGGNYGPTIPLSTEAAEKGYQQVLWLWKDEVCEVGTSNIFFYWINENGEKELVTPSLESGYILPGVTRDSILDITRSWGRFKVSERIIKMQEVIKAIKEGRLIEAFGAGTAVIVCPIELFHYQGKDYNVPIDPQIRAGRLTKELLEFIQDIQYGDRDYKNWQTDIKI